MRQSGLYNIKILSGIKALLELREDWENLCSRMENCQVFHCWAWYWSYINTLEKVPNALNFAIQFEENNVVLIFPFKIISKTSFGSKARILEIPFHLHAAQADFICDTPDRIPVFLKHLAHEAKLDWDYIHLKRSPIDSRACQANSFGSIPCCLSKVVGYSSVMPSLPYDNTLDRLDKKFRGNLRRQRNKLATLDNVYTKTVFADEEMEKVFTDFLRVEGSGWKGSSGTGTAIYLHPELSSFYKMLLKDFTAPDGVELNLLMHGEKPIAGQFSVKVGDCCYLLKIAYDEEYSNYAPGNMLLEYLLKRYQDGTEIKRINLMTYNKWQQLWQPQLLSIYEMVIFNRSSKGFYFYYSFEIKNYLRDLRNKLSTTYPKVFNWIKPNKTDNPILSATL